MCNRSPELREKEREGQLAGELQNRLSPKGQAWRHYTHFMKHDSNLNKPFNVSKPPTTWYPKESMSPCCRGICPLEVPEAFPQ